MKKEDLIKAIIDKLRKGESFEKVHIHDIISREKRTNKRFNFMVAGYITAGPVWDEKKKQPVAGLQYAYDDGSRTYWSCNNLTKAELEAVLAKVKSVIDRAYYIIVVNDTIEGSTTTRIAGLTDVFDKAFKTYKNEVEKAKREWSENCQEEVCVEESEGSFFIYEDGYACQNSTSVEVFTEKML